MIIIGVIVFFLGKLKKYLIALLLGQITSDAIKGVVK